MNEIVAILASLGIGTGLMGVLLAFSFSRRGASNARDDGLAPRLRDDHGSGRTPRGRSGWYDLLVPSAVGLLLGLVTRWPVAAVLAALAVRTATRQLTGPRVPQAVSRTEAIAVWTELLRDTLAAASGLSQAMIVIGPTAPIPIRDEAVTLANRIASGTAVDVALRSFSSELDDPSGDLVVCALLLAVRARTQKIVELLSALASSTREEVAMRLRVDASRAAARSAVRTITWFSLGFAGLLLVLARAYLAPYGTLQGQLVLSAVGVSYAAGVALMGRLVRPPAGGRLLEAATIT